MHIIYSNTLSTSILEREKITREIIKIMLSNIVNMQSVPEYISATHSICEDIEKEEFY